MRNGYIILLVCVSLQPVCFAQTDSIEPEKLFKIWIKQPEYKNTYKAVLVQVLDSAILVSDAKKKYEYRTGHFNTSIYKTPALDVLKLRRSHNINRFALIGTATGFAVAWSITVFTNTMQSDRSRNDWELAGLMGAWGALLGAVTGSIIGAIKIKIPIQGDQRRFDLQKERLKTYSIKDYSRRHRVRKSTSEP